MLRVVTTNNAEIFRHFGAKMFQALGVEHAVGTDYDGLLELVRTKRPQIAIFDVELPERDGFALCRAIKDDPALADVRVMIVLSSVVSRSQLRRVDECGCDDVLALPVHSDDFHHHIAQVVELPYRRHRRVAAGLDAKLEAHGARIVRIEDLSLGGLGITASGALSRGERVCVTLQYGGGELEPLVARVAWVRGGEGDTMRAGLHFEEIPAATRRLIEDRCLFDAVDGADGTVTVGLHGDIAEKTDLSRLAQRLESAGAIDFNMREVRYMSSIGVRTWVELIEGLVDKQYSFRHASMAFTSQVAMMPAVAGKGAIVSFEAPYRCETCDREDLRLLETKMLLRDGGEIFPPNLHCGVCRGELLFDDIPERYLAFAR